jgi:hypothetical protein
MPRCIVYQDIDGKVDRCKKRDLVVSMRVCTEYFRKFNHWVGIDQSVYATAENSMNADSDDSAEGVRSMMVLPKLLVATNGATDALVPYCHPSSSVNSNSDNTVGLEWETNVEELVNKIDFGLSEVVAMMGMPQLVREGDRGRARPWCSLITTYC